MRPATLTHDQQIAADSAWLERRAREVADKPAKPVATCSACRHFTPDHINPPAGMGTCGKGHGMWHAGAARNCADFQRSTQEPST